MSGIGDILDQSVTALQILSQQQMANHHIQQMYNMYRDVGAGLQSAIYSVTDEPQSIAETKPKGDSKMLKMLLKRETKLPIIADLLTRERPPIPRDSGAVAPSIDRNAALAEYAAITKAIGFSHPHIDADLRIEAFKEFLRAQDWGIFSLKAVVEYMDAKAAEESEAKAGWHWRPLRECDHLPRALFGRAGRNDGSRITPATDHYYGEHEGLDWNGRKQHEAPSSQPYDKLVPLHALRKVAAIEAGFAGEDHVSFFVSDYAPAPHIEYPDPFLMVVVNNARLAQGVGRFVIDFWDEPGFGIEAQMQRE